MTRKRIAVLILAIASGAASFCSPVPDGGLKPAAPLIVRTADVKIVVADTVKAVDAVTKSAEAAGGYVSSSSIWRDGELLRARLTLRVPADKLTATLASIHGVAARVENETVVSAIAPPVVQPGWRPLAIGLVVYTLPILGMLVLVSVRDA